MFTSEKLDIISVYRSSKGSLVELKNQLGQLISNDEKAVLITGDFNICYMKNSNNQVSKALQDDGFKQLNKNATHIQGGHIDHVYWRNGNDTFASPILDRYSPYYSDHDASLIKLTGKNSISSL